MTAALTACAVALASAWLAAPATAAAQDQGWFASSLGDPVTVQPESTGPVDPGPGSAPWSVLINVHAGSTEYTCSGSIMNASEVLTAGHCAVDEASGALFPTAEYNVVAGTATTNGSPPPSEQSAGVSAVNVFPGYVNGDHGDDIAMLTLSSPLTTSADVAPISAVAQGAEPAVGSAGVFYGWGQNSPGASDGNEHYLPFTFASPLACASGLPSILCALSSTGDSCPGDSGSGMTAGGLLVGVLDFGDIPTGGTACTSGHYIGYTDLASPEIAAWIAGSSAASLAPRTQDQATLAGDADAGGTDTCTAPAWSDGSNTGFAFFDAQSLSVLQSGPLSTFSIPQTMVGHQLSCAAEASSAGGSTFATASTYFTIAASISPGLSLTITRAGRLAAIASTSTVVVPLTLTVTRTGAVPGTRPVFSVVFQDSTPYLSDLENRFGAGSYDVCLAAPQTGIYAPASICRPWVQNGATAALVSIRATTAGGRAVFAIRTRAPLLGRTVKVRWFAGSCCTRSHLIVARSVRLGGLTAIAERPRGHRRRYALVFTLPTLAYRGATLRGGSRVIFTYEYGGRATVWRRL